VVFHANSQREMAGVGLRLVRDKALPEQGKHPPNQPYVTCSKPQRIVLPLVELLPSQKEFHEGQTSQLLAIMQARQ
jgi:hypothetical protein